MRIVAGTLRGRRIEAPEGQETRPTTDRVREALFSSLYSLRGGFEGAIVLDAFAGSGALGIEALSRGATRCTFYERDGRAADFLKNNVKACGLDARSATVLVKDIMKDPPRQGDGPFDLVFLDPPYVYDPDDVMALASGMHEAGALAHDAIIVFEHAHTNRTEVARAAEAAGFTVHASKKYGKTGVTLIVAG